MKPHLSNTLDWYQDDGFGNLIRTTLEHALFVLDIFLFPEH